MSLIDKYYNSINEEGRLLSQHGQVEYLTTMKYVHECLAQFKSPKVLEVGAGTGRYSVSLAKEGYCVTAIELVKHNLDILKSKLSGTEPITAIQGNALDLSMIPDKSFDLTMLLGPMYHLYSLEDKKKAMSEAIRVTKPGGYILVAYCMNDATIVQYVFLDGNLDQVINADFPIDRIKLVATDGFTDYFRKFIDEMDKETFAKWLEYHFAICERQDLIGTSNHTLDILKLR